jgi:hypothetical protein
MYSYDKFGMAMGAYEEREHTLPFYGRRGQFDAIYHECSGTYNISLETGLCVVGYSRGKAWKIALFMPESDCDGSEAIGVLDRAIDGSLGEWRWETVDFPEFVYAGKHCWKSLGGGSFRYVQDIEFSFSCVESGDVKHPERLQRVELAYGPAPSDLPMRRHLIFDRPFYFVIYDCERECFVFFAHIVCPMTVSKANDPVSKCNVWLPLNPKLFGLPGSQVPGIVP